MKLAYAANYYLPQYPIADKMLVLFYNREHFKWPDPKTHYDYWQNAAGGHLETLAFMIKQGMVEPNPEYWKKEITVLGLSLPLFIALIVINSDRHRGSAVLPEKEEGS